MPFSHSPFCDAGKYSDMEKKCCPHILGQVLYDQAGLMARSVMLWLKSQRYCVRIPAGSDVCHRGCEYTVFQTVQRLGVCSVVHDTVHCEEPLKSFIKNRPKALARLLDSFCRDIAIIVQKTTQNKNEMK